MSDCFRKTKSINKKTMKTQTLILLALLLIGATSCQKQPSTCFSPSASTIELGEAVSFSNCSTDAGDYKWDFGDNKPEESSKTCSHIYSASGSYIVTLTAYSKNMNKSDAATHVITVNDINQKFVGTYNMNGTCSGNGSYLLGITPFGANELRLSNFADNQSGWILHATVLGKTFTIPSQNFYDTDGTNVVSGSGSISGKSLTLNLSVSYYDNVNSAYNYNGSCIDTGNK